MDMRDPVGHKLHMMSNQADPIRGVIDAHIALKVLQLLDGILQGAGNDQLMNSILGVLGLRVSMEQLRERLEFLESKGAIAITATGGIVTFELQHHGHEIATGVSKCEGVEKPMPGRSY